MSEYIRNRNTSKDPYKDSLMLFPPDSKSKFC